MILLQPVIVESFACVYLLCVLCSCYVHTITVTFTFIHVSLPIVLFGVLTAGLIYIIIMMPFDQLLLRGLAACKGLNFAKVTQHDVYRGCGLRDLYSMHYDN